MGLINRLVYGLNDTYLNVRHSENLIDEIKDNINFLLNTNPNDCFGILNSNLLLISQTTLEKNEFSQLMGKTIQDVINQYETRIQILSIHYDDSLMPWKLSFSFSCCLKKDRFQEFVLGVDFYNNRYCEVW